MKIMYVTSECAPFIKTGGLGDVAGSLPQALAAKGHDVRVFCPLYSAIDQSMREKFYYIKNAYVRLGWRNQYCGIFRYEADGVTYYFIDNEYYFARGQIYGSGCRAACSCSCAARNPDGSRRYVPDAVQV